MCSCGVVQVYFNHTIQDYNIGTVALKQLPRCHWSKPLTINITLASECASWRLKSPAKPLFVQPHAQKTYLKENVKAPRLWPFVRGIRRSPVDSPHKGPVTWNLFACHDVFMRTGTMATTRQSTGKPCIHFIGYILLNTLYWPIRQRYLTNISFVEVSDNRSCYDRPWPPRIILISLAQKNTLQLRFYMVSSGVIVKICERPTFTNVLKDLDNFIWNRTVGKLSIYRCASGLHWYLYQR